MQVEILNRRDFPGRLPPNTILVDRTTMWGNPFIVGVHGDREEVIAGHRLWFPHQPKLVANIHRLVGRHLMCWCAPQACHAENLRHFAAEWVKARDS